MDRDFGKVQRILMVFLAGAIFALVWMERWRRQGNAEAEEMQTPTPPPPATQENLTSVGVAQQVGRRYTGSIVAGMKADLGNLRRAVGAGKRDVTTGA